MEAKFEGSFGAEIREALFSLDKQAAFTNHGSYGTVPRPVFEAHVTLLRRVETHPDSWFRRDIRPLYVSAYEAAANFIGASKDEVVLVENATTAVNTVLRTLNLGPADGVLTTTFAYNACRIAVEAACKDTGAKLHLMELKLPITSKESIVKMYSDYLDAHPDITFSLVDQITSPGALVLPVREIVRVCRERGVKVMVDGAHSPGQLPLNMKDLGAEYFTGNLHKWVFCPRACAVLYVKDSIQASTMPLVASHGHWATFHERFCMQATRDYTPYCMAPAAIDFYKKIGGMTAITAYNTELVSWAINMLCKRLSLSPLPVPPEMRAPFMALFSLPDCLGPPTEETVLKVMEGLFHKYNVQTTICLVDRKLWCRISAQVYNVREDYERLADALEEEIRLASPSAETQS